MSEWVYKATEKKVGKFETHHLAVYNHFLCRSAMNSVGGQADRVRDVQLGDVIHFYYRENNKPAKTFGSFVVVEGSKHPARFGKRIPGTALFEVLETPQNAKMLHRLTEEHTRDPQKGYQRDPHFQCFTGWVIERIDGHATPPFDQSKLFPGPMINLWKYPDASLGLPKAKKT